MVAVEGEEIAPDKIHVVLQFAFVEVNILQHADVRLDLFVEERVAWRASWSGQRRPTLPHVRQFDAIEVVNEDFFRNLGGVTFLLIDGGREQVKA